MRVGQVSPSGNLQILAALIAVSCLLLAAGCSGDPQGGGNNEQLMPAVEAVRADFGSLPLTERLNGLVRAKNQVELYPQITAAVVEVYVQDGDYVKAGDPLVRLRDTELRERLKQAEASHQIAIAQAKQADASLRQAQSEFRRGTDLADKSLISPTEFEDIETEAIAAEADAELARARVRQAAAAVEERKEALSFALITAPVDGTVGNRNAEVGQVVGPGTELFTIGQLDTVLVEVVLTDRMLSYIKEEQRTEITSGNLPYGLAEARVSRISPFLHPRSHSTTGEIDLVNPDRALKPGMFVTADIFYGESEQTTLVPLSALWENPATASVGVFVCADSLSGEPAATIDDFSGSTLTDPAPFVFVPVDVIAQGRMSAGVTGVSPGSWVVTIGQDLLGSDTTSARVRQVDWERVERQQKLQREDLLDEIINHRQPSRPDTALIGRTQVESGARS